MASSAGLIATTYGLQSLFAFGNAYAQAGADRAQAIYEQGIYDINAEMAEMQATDSIERGELIASELLRKKTRDVSTVRRTAKQIEGRQRVSFAAQGIEASGSAADTISETQTLAGIDEVAIKRAANLDILTIRNNAWRVAWGYKAQADEYRLKGRFTNLASKTKQRNTILTGSIQAMSWGLAGYGKYQEMK